MSTKLSRLARAALGIACFLAVAAPTLAAPSVYVPGGLGPQGCTPHTFTGVQGRITFRGVGYDITGIWTDGCGGQGHDDDAEGKVYSNSATDVGTQIGTFSANDKQNTCTATVDHDGIRETISSNSEEVSPSTGRVDITCGSGDLSWSAWMSSI